MRERCRSAGVWVPPLVLMAVIFAFSAVPSDDPHHGLVQFVLRKGAHFTEYALLVVLWFRALATRVSTGPALAGAVAIAVVYAATDELHQIFVSGRSGTPRDVAIDAAGALTAAFLVARARQEARA